MNCDRIARVYAILEHLVFGRALERRRQALVTHVAGAHNALLLGDGDGRFAEHLLRAVHPDRVELVDLSRGMLALGSRRLASQSSEVLFRQGDALHMPLAGPYDLVAAHFFFDCLTECQLDALVARVASHCTAGAQWLVSEFAYPEPPVARALGWLLIRLMYLFFRLATGLKTRDLPSHSSAMVRHGFRLQHREISGAGLLVSELWVRAGEISS